MSDVLSTINISDCDFLSDVVTNDDITLSQICETIEKQEVVFDQFDDIVKVQDFNDGIDITNFSESAGEQMMYGDFNVLDSVSDDLGNSENTRFGEITDDEIGKLINDQENKNTKRNTQWAVNVFQKWREEKNLTLTETKIPDLLEMNKETMNYYLSHFVCEARKIDGTEYPPKSLYYIVCGLLRNLRDKKIHDKNFLSVSDVEFAEFRKTLDAKMKQLLSKGLGTVVKQADPISEEDEMKIWEMEIFGSKTAETLQYTVFFYLCKLFGLRGYDEHHALECSNVVVGEDDRGKFVQFIGGRNKTFKGGLAQLGLESKNIKHYSQPGNRCIVDYFRMYLNALGNDGRFYRRSLAGTPIRYGTQVVGINKLKSMMKIICKKAGLNGNFTNHSGKRTCATQLYLAGVDEQEIMNRTGHRSEKAVRKYKRSSDQIAENVSMVLDPPEKKKPKSENIDSLKCESIDSLKCNTVCDVAVKNVDSEDVRSALRDVSNQFQNCQVSFHF